MLYVFQMDIGQMLTFDISLLMDSVARLQIEIAKTTGISVEKQILLVSGGHSLKPDQKVMTYGAGADTNPVFLFSKLAIENQEAPLVRSLSVTKDSFSSMKEQMTDAINLPANFDTVAKRTKIACQIRDAANRILGFCNNEFKEQHLQYQGWGTVVANLEEIAQALQKTEIQFKKATTAFLPQRENHFALLSNFGDILELLDRIPLLKVLTIVEVEEGDTSIHKFCMKSSMSNSQYPKSLLEWITNQGQGQSLDALHKQCLDELMHFDSELFDSCDRQVQELLTLVISDPHQMKELVGIERRLSELEKRLIEARKISKEQSDMAQGFLNHQARLNSTQDAASILPDLCKSHKQQLIQMVERQQRLEALQNNFRKSKQEMSKNIHQRLGWVMHIETLISKLDSELIYHMKTLRILDRNLVLLIQVKAAPQVYASMVIEAARRKKFSLFFAQWAEHLAEEASHLYKLETEKRKQFTEKLGEHFLIDTLFKGFDDIPPNFATEPPEPFDILLPNITADDIVLLKNITPELEELLSQPQPLDSELFPLSLLHKNNLRSSLLGVPHSQSSQTEWSQNGVTTFPCVITATEKPAYSFTVPEAFGSLISAEYMTTVPNLTEETLVSKNIDQNEKVSATPQKLKESQSVVSSFNVTDSSSAELPLKVQSKVNSDSTSPISSNEFATADFYFEDSMPSPMADSPLGKKEKKKDSCKSDIEMITSLHAELAEKRILIQELEQKLKEKESQLLDYEKSCSHRKCSSSEGSSTLVVTVDHLCSSETSTFTSGNGRESENISLEPSDSRLDAANNEIIQLKTILSETEGKLGQIQQQNEETVTLKNNVISSLENDLKNLGDELSVTKTHLTDMKCNKEGLEIKLYDCQVKCESQEIELQKWEETLISIRNKLKLFHIKMKADIPSLSQTLLELKSAVANNKFELDLSLTAALATVEKEVSTFNATILSDAYNKFKIEKDALHMEVEKLKDSLQKSSLEVSDKLAHLKFENDKLTTEMQLQQEMSNERLAQQKLQFETSLKDMETKYALEVELELDKCRAEMKESEETAERNIESLKQIHLEIATAMEKLKIKFEEEKFELQKHNEKSIEECEVRHAADKAVISHTFDGEIARLNNEQMKQKTEFEVKLKSIQSQLAQENLNALSSLREELTIEKDSHIAELKQQLEDQKLTYETLFEEKEQRHAENMTLLQTEFTVEHGKLQDELNMFKNRETLDVFTQLDFDLLSEIMTHSETQTGQELLAEVISLTSSASYGSEEMIPHKIQLSNVEEKDSTDLIKMQQINEELKLELGKTRDKIIQLEEEVAVLKSEKQDLSELANSDGEKNSELKRSKQEMQMDQSHCQDLMQSSNVSASIFVMDKELPLETTSKNEQGSTEQEVKARDEKIAHLEKKLKDLSLPKLKESTNDKVSIRGCDKGDIVLLCLDERHDQYVVFTVGTNLHFLHSESLECLGLQTGSDVCRKSWILAEVVDKEYCLAKKPNNRFRVPQGTCFYRVKCKPWKSDIELSRSDKDISKHTVKLSKQDNTTTTHIVKEKK